MKYCSWWNFEWFQNTDSIMCNEMYLYFSNKAMLLEWSSFPLKYTYVQYARPVVAALKLAQILF